MNVNISVSVLRRGIGAVAPIVGASSPIAACAMIKMVLDGGARRATFSAMSSDMAMMMSYRMDCGDELECDGVFSVLIHPKISSLLSKLPSDSFVRISFDSLDSLIRLFSGDAEYPFNALPGEDFPQFVVEGQEKCSLSFYKDEWIKNVEFVSWASSSDKLVESFSSMNFEIGGNEQYPFLETVCTDRVCLSYRRVPCVFEKFAPGISALVFSDMLKSVAKAIAKTKGDEVAVRLRFFVNCIHFSFAEYDFYVRCSAGSFPNYKAIAPKNDFYSFQIGFDVLFGALDRLIASHITAKTRTMLILRFLRGGLELTLSNIDVPSLKAMERVPLISVEHSSGEELHEDGVRIAVDINNLHKALSGFEALSHDFVNIRFFGTGSPLHIDVSPSRDVSMTSEYVYIMPMIE
jgi:DNA polymerase III sliding clamp (beta) subunit (PCNA family)